MSRFLRSLRDATAEEHKLLEVTMAFCDVARSPELYRNFLLQMVEIWSPLEKALSLSPLNREEFLQIPNRMRLSHLVNDLGFLRCSSSPLPLTGALPFLETVPLTRGAAAGLLYVLEGSRFGGEAMLATLAPLGINPQKGGSFFFGYGADTANMWKRFVAWADGELTEVELKEAGETAKTTFHAFRSHFAQRRNQ